MHLSIRTYRVGTGALDALMHRVDRDFAEIESMGRFGGEVMVSRAIAEMLEPAHR